MVGDVGSKYHNSIAKIEQELQFIEFNRLIFCGTAG